MIGTEPSLLRLYSSFSGRKALFKAAGVATPPHLKDVYSAEQLVEGLAWLVINHPFIRRWIFKMDHHSQGSGMGETNNHICTSSITSTCTVRVEAGIMRRVVLWVTACNFNAIILNQSILTVS